MQLSVIICTHNPRPDYLHRVLEALKAQTLPKDQWELLLIDNASKGPLALSWDLSWHPSARHFREDELGLTPARLRGIREGSGSILVFVDDDNVLNSDYLEQAWSISMAFPQMGVWGGSISGAFETEPPDWIKQRLGCLAVGAIESDAWATIKGFNAACPPGAGMVVRKTIACAYYQLAQTEPLRRLLGRKGSQLSSGEDIDLAWSACEMGHGMGRFSRLKLLHLIATRRLNVAYFEKLIEGGEYSNVLLYSFHGMTYDAQPNTPWNKLRCLKQQLMASTIERRLTRAARKGVARGLADLKEAISSNSPDGRGSLALPQRVGTVQRP